MMLLWVGHRTLGKVSMWQHRLAIFSCTGLLIACGIAVVVFSWSRAKIGASPGVLTRSQSSPVIAAPSSPADWELPRPIGGTTLADGGDPARADKPGGPDAGGPFEVLGVETETAVQAQAEAAVAQHPGTRKTEPAQREADAYQQARGDAEKLRAYVTSCETCEFGAAAVSEIYSLQEKRRQARAAGQISASTSVHPSEQPAARP
jgi:hypothetical protein